VGGKCGQDHDRDHLGEEGVGELQVGERMVGICGGEEIGGGVYFGGTGGEGGEEASQMENLLLCSELGDDACGRLVAEVCVCKTISLSLSLSLSLFLSPRMHTHTHTTLSLSLSLSHTHTHTGVDCGGSGVDDGRRGSVHGTVTDSYGGLATYKVSLQRITPCPSREEGRGWRGGGRRARDGFVTVVSGRNSEGDAVRGFSSWR
jgi:hypothetical protein